MPNQTIHTFLVHINNLKHTFEHLEMPFGHNLLDNGRILILQLGECSRRKNLDDEHIAQEIKLVLHVAQEIKLVLHSE